MSRPLISTVEPFALDAPVTKVKLFRSIWSDVIVSDNALTQAVSELRQASPNAPPSAKPPTLPMIATEG